MKSYDIEKAKDFFAAKVAFTTGLHEVEGMVERSDDVVIVDVRLPSDYRKAHVPGAVNLPNGQMAYRDGTVPREAQYPLLLFPDLSSRGRGSGGAHLARLSSGRDGRRFRGLAGEWLRHREPPSNAGSASALTRIGAQDRAASAILDKLTMRC